MKKLLFRLSVLPLALLVLATPALAVSASTVGDIVKAEKIITAVMKATEQYRAATIALPAPAPLAGNSGKYLVPFKANGEITEWAAKSFNAQAGGVVGEQAGGVAAKAVASKIPFGGLLGGAMKKKGKSMGAIAALGGEEFMRTNSELSFNDLNDYAVYLHATHSRDANYQSMLATVMAVYPELEGSFEGAIKQAYAAAAKAPATATPTKAAP